MLKYVYLNYIFFNKYKIVDSTIQIIPVKPYSYIKFITNYMVFYKINNMYKYFLIQKKSYKIVNCKIYNFTKKKYNSSIAYKLDNFINFDIFQNQNSWNFIKLDLIQNTRKRYSLQLYNYKLYTLKF